MYGEEFDSTKPKDLFFRKFNLFWICSWDYVKSHAKRHDFSYLCL